MKTFIHTIILFTISLVTIAQDKVSATYDVSFSKKVETAYINEKEYKDVTVFIKTSKQGYEVTFKSGYTATKHIWVKVKVKDSNNKTIYSKKFKRSGLFVFENGGHMQIGKADNVSTEAVLKRSIFSDGWYFELNENGLY